MSVRDVSRWAGRLLAGLAALVVVAGLVVWLWGGAILGRAYPVENRGFEVAAHAVDLAEGERLARVTGCMDGCHGEGATGRVFFEAPFVVKVIAPNLTTLGERYTDAEIEALVRQGVRPDGRSLWGMPSSAFASMSDEHLASVLAYLDTLPDSGNDFGESSFAVIGRWELIRGEIIQPEAAKAAGVESPAMAVGDGAPGAYLATLACAECHGLDYAGQPGFAPALEVAKAYDLAQFTRLMREGIALGDREVGLMSQVARGRFRHLEDDEIASLHAYFHAR